MEKQLKYIIGADNGVSGTWAIIRSDGELVDWFKTPVFKCLSYAKNGKYLNRIDRVHLYYILKQYKDKPAKVLMEYPMISPEPQRIHSTFSAAMSFADTWGVVEDLKLPHEFVTAKDWQKVFLPAGTKGSYDIKKATRDLALRWYPKLEIPKSCDGDAVMIAEYGRRTGK